MLRCCFVVVVVVVVVVVAIDHATARRKQAGRGRSRGAICCGLNFSDYTLHRFSLYLLLLAPPRVAVA